MQETQRLVNEPAPGICATPKEGKLENDFFILIELNYFFFFLSYLRSCCFVDNLRYFDVMIAGPQQSPYEGGVFKLELFLTGIRKFDF